MYVPRLDIMSQEDSSDRKRVPFLMLWSLSYNFAIEVLEGNKRPNELPSDTRIKKTTNLILSLCKSLYSAGKVRILDSSFCVLEGLIKLGKVGVFSGALIKKQRYWTKHIKGDMINTYFQYKEVG